eukprot:864811_1
MLSKYTKQLMTRSILPALTTIRHQSHKFTIYSGYGKTTPELEAMHDEWVNLYNMRDVNKLLELYASDCTIMPCGSDSISGHTEAKKFFAEHINQVSEVVAHLDEGEVMDTDAKMAFIRGTYTYVNIGDVDNVVDDGKNVLILKRDSPNDKWKIYVDIWA